MISLSHFREGIVVTSFEQVVMLLGRYNMLHTGLYKLTGLGMLHKER